MVMCSRVTNLTITRQLPTLPDIYQPFVFDVTTRLGALRLEISDTRSPIPYRKLHPNVLVLCYDISRRATLHAVQARWKYEVETHFNYDEQMPIMLLGLKRDLRRENQPECVMPQEGINTAQEMRCDRYAECSAITGELCAMAFEDVVTMAVGTRREDGGKSQGAACILM